MKQQLSPARHRSGEQVKDPVTRLKEDFRQNLCVDHWLSGDNKFLPRNCLSKLLQIDRIKECMPTAEDTLIKLVADEATLVFATILRSNCGSYGSKLLLQSIVEMCLQHGLCDRRLPIPDVPTSEYDQEAIRATRPELQAFDYWGDDSWGIWESFYNTQWTFLAPTFTRARLEHTLPARTILPFTGYAEEVSSGNFGSVSKAYLHANHVEGFDEVSCSAEPR